MANGFTLSEAMSAVEVSYCCSLAQLLLKCPYKIGDPRMDSGAITASEAQQPAFDPLTPLLPGEVCWILDRTVACEVTDMRVLRSLMFFMLTEYIYCYTYVQMQWHVGNALAQTMYTCLYMHYLPMINPDFLKYRSIAKTFDKQRPLELISLVIRSGVLGVVKCCDLVYRELVKGNVHDVSMITLSFNNITNMTIDLTLLLSRVKIGKVKNQMFPSMKAFLRKK